MIEDFQAAKGVKLQLHLRIIFSLDLSIFFYDCYIYCLAYKIFKKLQKMLKTVSQTPKWRL